MASVEVKQFACLQDNYGVLVHDPASGTTIAIDAPDSAPYLAALEESGWTLTHILITHHHWDHVDGLAALKAATGAHVTGPKLSAGKIPQMDATVEDGDEISCGPIAVKAIATPGHTLDQISWYFPDGGIAHTGDTLFALGCGRIFEGDAPMMWASLSRLMERLPKDTVIYCGHEYTAANARFAMTVDPENADLKERASRIEELRAKGESTLPTTLEAELKTNPFLRAADPAIRARLGMTNESDAAVFAEIRSRKDRA